MINQSKAVKLFNEQYREDFNKDLFHRSEDDIIDELKKVILSCQRNKSFILQVKSFTVVENYDEINDILFKYEEHAKLRTKNKKKDNVYEYINLKDSDVKLLIVEYFAEVQNERAETEKDIRDTIRVIIAIPRVIDKYYFRISGNIYSAMYQIVDGSTYNNSTSSNNKTHSVTLKTMFMPIRLYRNKYTLVNTDGESFSPIIYRSKIFNKSLSVMKYIFAKYGLYECLNVFEIRNIYITQSVFENENYYSFEKNGIFINVPKIIFDDHVVQSLICTIHESIIKNTSYNDLFTNEFWIKSLGGNYNKFTLEKGESILDSLENIYDISTKEDIKLPIQDKQNIYYILRWMCREFSELKMKDNLDISIKNIRWGQYIASLYAAKILKGIYRISDIGRKVGLDGIRKAIVTAPNFLLSSITKCALVNYKNLVNDNDAFVVLKYTYKGISGIGDTKNNSVPDIYRTIHHSHLSRVDLDSSSTSDPGMSGTICPLTDLYNYSFSDYQEPNTWSELYKELVDEHKKISGVKDGLEFRKEILDQDVDNSNILESMNSMNYVLGLVLDAEKNSTEKPVRVNLEGGGLIYYE